MGLEFIAGVMVINTKVNTKMVIEMAKVNIFIKVEQFMREISK